MDNQYIVTYKHYNTHQLEGKTPYESTTFTFNNIVLAQTPEEAALKVQAHLIKEIQELNIYRCEPYADVTGAGIRVFVEDKIVEEFFSIVAEENLEI